MNGKNGKARSRSDENLRVTVCAVRSHRCEAERVELVLGDGILSWRRADGGIYHPILLQRLQLQFDASVPEFTLSEADHPVELYSALFHR